MHAKYTTSAFLLSSSASGEADRLLSFYTRDFGRINAVAKSLRLMKSKLKAPLEVGNFLLITLVKGRDIWRLTEAQTKEEIFFPSANFNIFLKITKLLKSLVPGEEINPMLFSALESTHTALRKKDFNELELQALECITVVRILDALGYGREELDWGISVSAPIEDKLLKQAILKKEYLISLINKSLEESHLQ